MEIKNLEQELTTVQHSVEGYIWYKGEFFLFARTAFIMLVAEQSLQMSIIIVMQSTQGCLENNSKSIVSAYGT